MKNGIKRGALAALGLVLVAGCGSTAASGHPASSTSGTASGKSGTSTGSGSSASQSLTTVTLRLDYIPVGYQAPIVYGIQTGIYKQHGLNVKWAFGSGSSDTASVVGENKAQFGVGNAVSSLELATKNVPVKMVMGYLQESPAALVVPANSPITKPAQVAGHTIGVSPGSSTLELFPAYLQAIGVPLSKVKTDSMSPSATPLALYNRTVDAILNFGFEIQPEMNAKNFPTRIFDFAAAGVDPMYLGIISNETTMTQHPTWVKEFVAATQASIKAAMANPSAAVQALYDAAPKGTAPSESVLLQQFKGSMPLFSTPNDKGHAIGWMSPTDWKNTETLAQKYLGLKTSVPLSAVYTDQFINDTAPGTSSSN